MLLFHLHELYGWGNQVFSTAGASANHKGDKLSLTPKLLVNNQTRTITLTYSAKSLSQSNWQGVKVYISTWDTDGEGVYRNISMDGSEWDFGGASGDSPRILDDIGPLLISN